jgi:hypothetical protein
MTKLRDRYQLNQMHRYNFDKKTNTNKANDKQTEIELIDIYPYNFDKKTNTNKANDNQTAIELIDIYPLLVLNCFALGQVTTASYPNPNQVRKLC